MGYAPTNQGQAILQWPFKAGPAAGLLPWRMVCLDQTVTVGYGEDGQAKVKHPSTTFTDGEKVIGVIIAPNVQSIDTINNLWDAFKPIAQNIPVTVRMQGIVPIITDNTTDSTAIEAGDFVRASTSTTSIGTSGILLAGTAAKGTLTGAANNPAADQHIIGYALNRVAPASDQGQYVMTYIQPVEA